MFHHITKTFASVPAYSHRHLLLGCYRRQDYVAASAGCSQEHPLMSFPSRYPSLSSWYRYTQKHNHIFCHLLQLTIKYVFPIRILFLHNNLDHSLCFAFSPSFLELIPHRRTHRLPKPKPHAGGSIPFGNRGFLMSKVRLQNTGLQFPSHQQKPCYLHKHKAWRL